MLVDEGALRRLLGLREHDPVPQNCTAALLVVGAALEIVLDEELRWLGLDIEEETC